jgi:hypothetical protein
MNPIDATIIKHGTALTATTGALFGWAVAVAVTADTTNGRPAIKVGY